ncbi:MAG: HD domain-containing phosphohydrolase [Veillonellales bacterium]
MAIFTPLRIAILFVCVNSFLLYLVNDMLFKTPSGWIYILITTVLLYWLLTQLARAKPSQAGTIESSDSGLSWQQRYEKTIRVQELLRQNKEKIQRQNEYLASLHETTLGLMNRLNLADLLTAIVKRAGELLHTPHGYIYLVEPDQQSIEIKVGVGIYACKAGRRQQLGWGLCGKVWQEGVPLAIADYQLWEHRLPDSMLNVVHSAIGVPLKSGSQVVGVIGLDYIETSRSFGEDEISLLSRFAALASIALDNARLYSAAQADLLQQKASQEALKQAEKKIRRQNSYLSSLHETALSLMNRFELTDLLEAIITRAAVLADTPHGFIALVDSAHKTMTTKAGTGLYADRVGKKIQAAEGLAGTVWLSGQLITVNDYHNWPGCLADTEFDEIQSILGIPLISNSEVVGVIGLAYSENSHCFNKDETEFLNGFAKLASIALNNAQLYNTTQYLSFHDRLTGLYNRAYFEEESHRISTSRFFPIGVIVFDIDGLKLVNDTLGHMIGDEMLKAAADIIRQCFRQSDVIARIGGDEFAVLLPNTTRQIAERGCLRVKNAIPRYNDKHLTFLPLSISIGLAFSKDPTDSLTDLFKEADDYMYREKLQRRQSTRSAIVETLKSALAARDFLTEGHGERLQDLAAKLADHIGLPEQKISDIRLLAQFHDIGKIGISDAILFKPESLTSEEFAEMKRHSEIGYRIAHTSHDLSPIAQGILKHHEWWNGSGYPLGLTGEDIPLECRIIAIADAYDAMTSDRPYRKALTREQALAELEHYADIQFDPYLVEAFISLSL